MGVYRIIYRTGYTGASTSTETEYCESRTSLHNTLLELEIACQARSRKRNSLGVASWLTWEWWAQRGERIGDDDRPPLKVLAVHEYVAGEWIELKWEISEPVLTFTPAERRKASEMSATEAIRRARTDLLESMRTVWAPREAHREVHEAIDYAEVWLEQRADGDR